MTLPGSLMDEVSAVVEDLTGRRKPVTPAAIKAAFPGVDWNHLRACYRLARLDLILPRAGKPLNGNTATERAVVASRIDRMRAWKVGAGEKPSTRLGWTVPRTRMPARLAKMASDERGTE